ncbi:hypothetical protein ACOZ38_25550 [Sphaerisporangium viridialbum]|uniref:hypothetical protein n=1 Tax=Sphaerisporangium viridialbum TaxID=46189 RepID=UPI003C77C6C5
MPRPAGKPRTTPPAQPSLIEPDDKTSKPKAKAQSTRPAASEEIFDSTGNPINDKYVDQAVADVHRAIDEGRAPVPTSRPRKAPTRTRKPVWTTRKPTIAHLYEDINDRLNDALESTGFGLQDLFELAIDAYCNDLNPPIPEQMPEDSDLKVPRNPNADLPGTPSERVTVPPAVIRLMPNTRARLVAACKQEQLGGKDVINDALLAYLDRLDMGK